MKLRTAGGSAWSRLRRGQRGIAGAAALGMLAVAGSLLPAPADAERRKAVPAVQSPAAAAPSPSTPEAATAPSAATAPASQPAPRPFGTVSARPASPPEDIPGAKAFAVFESACASCHQAKPGQPLSAAGGFGNILDVSALETDPSLVRPGLPDGSKLYQTLLTRHAPLDVFRDNPGAKPSIADVETVRAWIEQLKAPPRCTDRQPITPADLATLMQRWLVEVGPEAAKSTRFVSLAHIYNACASEAELAAYRQGAEKLLNSLSWAPVLARVETVGDGTALLAFKLSDLAWVPAHWDRLAANEPQGGAVKAPDDVVAATGSKTPVLRADWLAYAAGQAPLYYELLGLPERQADLLRLLAIDAGDSHARRVRAGMKASGETKGPRIVERLSGREQRFAWLAYDFAATANPLDIFDQPLEPQAGGAPRAGAKAEAVKPEGMRLLLGLPNGMLLFTEHDAAGRRVDALGGLIAGQACMACHATGIIGASDEVRAHVQAERPGVTRETKEAALALYPGQSELQTMFEDDAYRYRRTLIQAGIDPDLTFAGLEPVTALARRYERDVDLNRLAAEGGLEPEALGKRLTQLQGEARALGQRLLQGLLPRAEAERLLVALADPQSKVPPMGAAEGESGGKPAMVPATIAGLGVSLWSDRASYHVGDLVTFNVQVSEDCYLTLIDVDSAGKATVLFPNDFEQENLVAAGSTVRIPSEKSPYQLRFKEKGQETAVAVCSQTQKLPAGIELDYERQRFPSLGLWRNFLSLNQSEEVEGAKSGGRPKAAPRATKGRTAEVKSEAQKPPRSEAQGRAAIAVMIE